MTIATDTTPQRAGARAWTALLAAEARMVLRDVSGLLVPFVLPVLLLLALGSSISGERGKEGWSALEVYIVPTVLAMVMALIALVNMPSFLASYRHGGLLKRLSTTPLSPLAVLGSQVVVSLVQAALGIALAVLVARLALDLRLPADVGATLLALGATLLAMYGVGIVIASLAPSPNSAVAIGMLAFLGLGALGGMFAPREAMPGPLETIGEFTPHGAGVEAISAAWLGTGIDTAHVVALGLWALAGAVVAAVAFRWD